MTDMRKRKWFVGLGLALFAVCVAVLVLTQAGKDDHAGVAQDRTGDDDARMEALISILKMKGPVEELQQMGEPQFAGGFFDSLDVEEEEPYDPTIREIVGLGVRALPKLIEHLDDKTKTKIELTHDGVMGGIMYGAEHDPRFRDPKRQPKITGTGEGFFDGPKSYVLTVGDLAKLAIGEIVNRSLKPFRGQHTNIIIINSTSHNASLKEAVEQDWAGLTEEGHRKQLEHDALDINSQFHGGLKRLLFYYPAEGENLTIKLLSRPIKDVSRILDAAVDMVKTDDPVKWREIYDQAVKKYGSDDASINADYIHYTYVEWNDPNQVSEQESARAKKIVPMLFPDFKPYESRFYNLASVSDHRDLVNALKRFPSKKIDAAVQDVFRRALKDPTGFGEPVKADDWIMEHLDGLALYCFGRMRGKGYDEEYISYFRRRVKEFPNPDKETMPGSDILQMRKWLNELSPPTGSSRS